MSAVYAMIIKSNSSVGFWEDCKAATERAAKCEAWKRFGAGYNGDVIEVAIKHADGQYQPVARRAIGANTKWSAMV